MTERISDDLMQTWLNGMVKQFPNSVVSLPDGLDVNTILEEGKNSVTISKETVEKNPRAKILHDVLDPKIQTKIREESAHVVSVRNPDGQLKAIIFER